MAGVNPIPKGMHTVTPNLVVRDCAKAIEFYVRALAGPCGGGQAPGGGRGAGRGPPAGTPTGRPSGR